MEAVTSELQNTDLSNPPLKVYFDTKLRSIDQMIYYTKVKIKSIVTCDLNLNLNELTPYMIDVILEALPYYLENWDGWEKLRSRTVVSEEEYENFKTEMKKKLIGLIEKEKYYMNKFSGDEENRVFTNSFDLPPQIEKLLAKKDTNIKTKLPFTLQFKGSVEQLYGIVFENHDNNDLTIVNNNLGGSSYFTTRQILNLPFVSAKLVLPGIITLGRTNPFQIDRFLCKISDSWKFPSFDNIVSVTDCSKSPDQVVRPPIVLTLNYFLSFVRKLIIIMKGYHSMYNEKVLQDIVIFLYEFLSDAESVKLHRNTICETKKIMYNISQTKYYNDNCKNIEKCGPNDIILRTILKPLVEFCLYDINLTKDPVSGKDFCYFDFDSLDNVKAQNYTALSEIQKEFVKNLSSCMQYRCLMCNKSFQSIGMLGIHVKISHPVHEVYVCTKCLKCIKSCNLLTNRWSHMCQVK